MHRRHGYHRVMRWTELIFATRNLTARKKFCCPHCPFSTTSGYDTRWSEPPWRHLDAAGTPLTLRMLGSRRRPCCPAHGVVVPSVPFAPPHRSRFTRNFEDLVA